MYRSYSFRLETEADAAVSNVQHIVFLVTVLATSPVQINYYRSFFMNTQIYEIIYDLIQKNIQKLLPPIIDVSTTYTIKSDTLKENIDTENVRVVNFKSQSTTSKQSPSVRSFTQQYDNLFDFDDDFMEDDDSNIDTNKRKSKLLKFSSNR